VPLTASGDVDRLIRQSKDPEAESVSETIVSSNPEVLFACLIIRTFQLVFSVETVFFSHNKSVGTVFRLVFSANLTNPSSF